MSGHTPGPWRLVETEQPTPYYSGLVALTAQSPYIAIVTDGRVCDSTEWGANGRLIAAAPDLLAAAGGLAWLGNNLHNYGTVKFREFLEAAILDGRAAIAKAEGLS